MNVFYDQQYAKLHGLKKKIVIEVVAKKISHAE